MNGLGLIFLVTFHLSAAVQLQDSRELLKVALYYEALCPGCVYFITKELYPAYQKIGSSLVLEFVPVGSKKKSNDTWHFSCSHGQVECALNKVHACGLAASSDQDKSMQFLNCMESQSYSANEKSRTKTCAPILDLTADSLLQCSQSPKGDELFAQSIDKALALQPPLKLLPTIIYNDKFDMNLLMDSLGDFLGTACKLFSVKPAGCN